ncbi:BN159_2729 family protein [Streptomyces sp. NPDC048664]|uniref:BN159_2729 family protein n=1 Tax=Streptomyces sp. NPDC048664 TaxID=3154505 RepID=UPI00341BB8F6
MTTTPNHPGPLPPARGLPLTAGDIEHELAQRLAQLAHAFITDLRDRGHLTTPEAAPRVPAPSAPTTTVTATAQPPTPRWERVSDVPHRPAPRSDLFATTLAQLQEHTMHRLEVTRIGADHQQIHIHITPLTPGDWDYWLAQINTSRDAPTLRDGVTRSTTGHINGVPTTLTAHMGSVQPWPSPATG